MVNAASEAPAGLGRRRAVDWLVFGAFAVVSWMYRSGPGSVVLCVLAIAGLRFADSPPSRFFALLSFLLGWFVAPAAGVGLLAVAWILRAMARAGRRLGAPAAVVTDHAPSASGASPEPMPLPTQSAEEMTSALKQVHGDVWPSVAIAHDEEAVRLLAVQALAASSTEESTRVLAGRLTDEASDDVLCEIVRTLRDRRTSETVDALAKLVTTRPRLWWPIQEAAIRALAGLDDARVVPALVRAVRPRDSLLYREVLDAVTTFGAQARPALEDALDEPHPATRQLAAEALGRIGSVESVARVAALLEAREPLVRVAALIALGELQATSLADTVLVRLDEPAWEVRAAAAQALGRLNARAAVPRLVARLHDAHDEVVRACIASLASLGDATAVSPLLGLLNDPRWRPEVMPALLALPRDGMADRLRELLRSEDPALVTATVYLLADLGDKKVAGDIVALLNSVEPSVQLAAVEALGEVGDPAVCATLRQLRQHPNRWLRRAAARSASRLGCPVDA